LPEEEVLLEKTDILVIGAGIIGTSAAFFLSQENSSVTLIDKSCIGREASGATAGTMSFQNKEPRMVPFVQESTNIWRFFQERLGDAIEFRQPGGFRIAENEEELSSLYKSIEKQKKAGLEVNLVMSEELKRLAPYLGPSVVAATYYEKDGRSNPVTSCLALAAAAKENGAEVIENETVKAIKLEGKNKFLVQTSKRLFQSSCILNAAGVWSKDIFRMIGLEFPITLDPMQVMVTEPSPPIFEHIITHVRGNLTLKQVDSGNVVIGGGWKGEGDEKKSIKNVIYESMKGNVQSACRAIPALGAINLIRCWVGLEGRTPDQMPLLGPIDSFSGFFSAACVKGGWTLGPLLGKLAAEMILGRRPSLRLDEFAPGRFLER